jgi:hypothetical protein
MKQILRNFFFCELKIPLLPEASLNNQRNNKPDFIVFTLLAVKVFAKSQQGLAFASTE